MSGLVIMSPSPATRSSGVRVFARRLVEACSRLTRGFDAQLLARDVLSVAESGGS